MMQKEIGGYFGLELNSKFNNIGKAIALNSARNSLRYIIKAYDIKEIFIPYYTCPVVYQALEKEKCKISCYHIDNDFMPICKFKKEDFIFYTNYFGICAKNVKVLARKYKNLIIDNAQAFYMPKTGIATFNSIRKFFGVPDGALLYCDKNLKKQLKQSVSYNKFSHLVKRLDISASYGYTDFRKNSEHLAKEPIKYMSNLTTELFNSIDIQQARKKRLKNFIFLHSKLSKTNKLNINLTKEDVPMIYPYLIKNGNKLREQLIKQKIYVAQYWNDLKNNTTQYNTIQYALLNTDEKKFIENLIAIPIDQRYSIKDMKKIMEVIHENNN